MIRRLFARLAGLVERHLVADDPTPELSHLDQMDRRPAFLNPSAPMGNAADGTPVYLNEMTGGVYFGCSPSPIVDNASRPWDPTDDAGYEHRATPEDD